MKIIFRTIEETDGFIRDIQRIGKFGTVLIDRIDAIRTTLPPQTSSGGSNFFPKIIKLNQFKFQISLLYLQLITLISQNISIQLIFPEIFKWLCMHFTLEKKSSNLCPCYQEWGTMFFPIKG